MDFNLRDAATVAAIVFSAGAIVNQGRTAFGDQKRHAARLAAVESLAGETAQLVKATADALRSAVASNERVLNRLEQHEREGAAVAERVDTHGREIRRLRDKVE